MKRNFIYRCSIVGMCLLVFGMTAVGCASKERIEKEDAYRKIGINSMEKGEYEEALTAFDSALDLSLGKITDRELDICYYKAAAQYAKGDTKGAVETYDSLVEYDDENADVYFLRGSVYLKDGDTKKAFSDYQKAAEYAENNEMYLEIYNNLDAAGYPEDAMKYLDQALEKKSGKSAKNRTVKGRIYLLLEDYDNAVKELKDAIEAGDSEANLYLSKVYEAQGNTSDAEKLIEAYIEENKESSVAYNAIGRDQMEKGDYKAAAESFLKGLKVENVTNEKELRSNLIAAYEYAGDFASAKSEMETFIRDYPNDKNAEREHMFLESR